MNQLDRFYRALTDYRKLTVGDYDCDRLRDSIASANAQDDVVELERKICTVEQDWIDEIEKGLTYIEKAIREERQFIRSNGEVVPIEKVKRVDKESVAHLARHSNLLTKEPEEGADIIPDELYTVERLSDYAVYENRFLYMLLCYLRDFITLRYDKVVELTTTYNGSLSLNKVITHRKQRIAVEVKLAEHRKNDPYLIEFNEAKDAISRMDLILKAVIHYLNTPLMEEVAKTPMLKPPITKTNVLKMNQNFKACMALYEYVTAYNKPGYTVENLHRKLNPFPELISDEFAEATSLLSFLTYEHSMGIHEYLREEYNKEEARRKEEEKQKLVEQIRSLRKRIRESGVSPEEYMLLLEKRNRMLESDSAQLVIAKQEIERLNNVVEELTETVESLETEVQSLQNEIVEINARHEREIAELKEEHAKEIAELIEKHEKEISDLKDEHAREIMALTDEYESKIADLKEEHANEISALTQEYESKISALIEEYDTQIAELTTKHEEEVSSLHEKYTREISDLTESYTAQIDALEKRNQADRTEFEKTLKGWQDEYTIKEEKLRAEWALDVAEWKERIREKNLEIGAVEEKCEKAREERRIAEGRMNAMRLEHGLIKDEKEFMSQASFDELEHQYRLLKKLFKQEWAKVKKELRERFVWKLLRKKPAEETATQSSQTAQTPAEQPIANLAETAQTTAETAQENATPIVETPVETTAETGKENALESVAIATATQTEKEESTPAQVEQTATQTEQVTQAQDSEKVETAVEQASKEELISAVNTLESFVGSDKGNKDKIAPLETEKAEKKEEKPKKAEKDEKKEKKANEPASEKQVLSAVKTLEKLMDVASIEASEKQVCSSVKKLEKLAKDLQTLQEKRAEKQKAETNGEQEGKA